MIIDALTPYGHVLSVKTLTIQAFAAVKSGTRLVSMVIAKAIPAEIGVAGFPLAFKYRGQDPTCFACRTVGHTVGNCPKSRKKRSGGGASTPQHKGDGHNTPPPHGKVAPVTSKSPAVSPGAVPLAKSNPPDGAASQRDLREVLNASKRASKKAPPKDPPPCVPQHTFAVDLPSSPAGRSAAQSNRAGKGCRLPGASTAEQSLPTESTLQRDSFDFTMEVAATPAAPAASKWAVKSNCTVSQQEGKALEVVIPNPPGGKAVSSLVTQRRRHRWQRSSASTRIVGSKTGHSSSSESDSSMRRPVHKRPKAVEGENTTPAVQANAPEDGPWAPSSSPLNVQDLDECLDGASVVDPVADVEGMADVKEGSASVPSVQESEEDGDRASPDVPSLGFPASSSEVGSTQELLVAQVALPSDSSSDGESPGTEISCDEAPASRVSELLIEELPFLYMEF